MGVVESLGDGGDDPDHVGDRYPVGVTLGEQLPGVGAGDVLHRDPEAPITIPAVVDRDDVGMVQRGHHLGFLVEPLPIFVVVADAGAEDLQRVLARQAGMLGEVHLAHATAAEDAQDGVVGEEFAVPERHQRTQAGTAAFSDSRAAADNRASSRASSVVRAAAKISAIRVLVASSTWA